MLCSPHSNTQIRPASQPAPALKAIGNSPAWCSMTDRWVDLPAHFVIVLQSRQAGQHLHEREADTHNTGRPIHQLRRNGLVVVPLPCLSMRQTLCGVRHPQRRQAGRHPPARPHRSPRVTPFRPCICFADHTWTQTHGQRKEGNLWISLLVCFAERSQRIASLACRGPCRRQISAPKPHASPDR